MKTNPLPHTAQATYAKSDEALPNLFLILHLRLSPGKIPALINSGEIQQWHTVIETHCNNLILDCLMCCCASEDISIRRSLQSNWCALNILLDIAWGNMKKHPELKPAYQPVLDALIQVYEYLDLHFRHLYPAGSKMPDMVVAKHVAVMKSGYQKLMKANKNNGLLEALLYPVWEVIKHTGKGNNTYHRVMYAFQLLSRVKLWHHARGTYDQLYEIAISMNINSPEFLAYLNSTGKNALATHTDVRGKKQLLNNWHTQYREALWINNQTRIKDGYNSGEQHIATWLINWLQEQKEYLETETIDENQRFEIAKDLAFLCWHTKISVEAGFYKSNIVKPIVLALANIISTGSTSAPSFQSIERLIKGTEIPYQTKDELAAYFNNCLKQLFKVPEKGVRPAAAKSKRKTTDRAKTIAKAGRKK